MHCKVTSCFLSKHKVTSSKFYICNHSNVQVENLYQKNNLINAISSTKINNKETQKGRYLGVLGSYTSQVYLVIIARLRIAIYITDMIIYYRKLMNFMLQLPSSQLRTYAQLAKLLSYISFSRKKVTQSQFYISHSTRITSVFQGTKLHSLILHWLFYSYYISFSRYEATQSQFCISHSTRFTSAF